ncbi:gag/pol protein [Cucumis melo var. makuwa]|uniref:Gag/pol protein n=1 Tax=Cucumis melo var. makuwa TaxID=1194695 RepID=A0A5D3DIF4_CUCMM|nr:gag/pol protein [Cucumis melo var. makuwa]TYK23407.1 gag/pol protein [Cucumis melo var. makuwa]
MRRIPYASIVGSLMYVMLCTRPDICYVVGIVSRYQSNPGLNHWTTVKIILKYLRRARDYMLVYGAKDLILTGYTDTDLQTNKDSRKSTSGSVFTLNGGAIVWCSIKQGCIADSTMEAEYIAALANSKEPRSHKRGKHIERKYHLIREILQRGDVIVTKIASEHNIVDPFTKTLTAKVFKGHLESLGLRDMYIRGTLHKQCSGFVERIHQSRDSEGCTYQSSDPEGYTYQSSDPEGYTYQSSDPEGYTYQSSDPEGYTYQ